jgi:hypothetical protein
LEHQKASTQEAISKKASSTEDSTQDKQSFTSSRKSLSVPEKGSESVNEQLDLPPKITPKEITPKPTIDAKGYLTNGWLIWEELRPEDWDPQAIFRELDISNLADDDPRAEKIIDDFLVKWRAAPVNDKINHKAIKIPGFVVPLDFESRTVAEFFLVPFFGACIHVPPPPPNQIVLVRLAKPMDNLAAMEVVWVYGKIEIETVSNDLGQAGYSLKADSLEFYQENLEENP